MKRGATSGPELVGEVEKVGARPERLYYPTHGAPIADAPPFVADLVAHRHQRERQIAACLADGIAAIPDMVARMYADVDPRLHRAAGRSVLAHLVHMIATGRAACDGEPRPEASFRSG